MIKVESHMNDVMDHLKEIIQKVENTRDYVRVCGNLINSDIEIQAYDKTPLELQLALDMLRKIDSDLDYYNTSLSEDLKILVLAGALQ